MKYWILTVVIVALFCVHASAEADKPNILLFLVDDMGLMDTSVPMLANEQGNPKRHALNDWYRTPNMERLAAMGTRFSNFYSHNVCSPTRVSLMTGQNAARHRTTDWINPYQNNRDMDNKSFPRVINRRVPPEWNWEGLTKGNITLPAVLKRTGYTTIHIGKGHFAPDKHEGADPRNIGFDANIGGSAIGHPQSYYGKRNYGKGSRQAVPHLETYHGTETFLSEALTLEAKAEMDKALAAEKPFFLYMSHYAVHVPFAEDPRFIGPYLEAGMDHTEAMYAALLEGMDKSLGDILDALEEQGVADNTVVLFMSDNGGLSAHGRGGEPHTHNAPLSSGKGSAHEGGIRVPMIACWPGVTQPDTVCDDYVIIEDFFPSILEVAGATHAGITDGRSFVPLLEGKPGLSAGRCLVWHYPNNWGPEGPGLGSYSSIRWDDWKLIYYHDPNRPERYELFNVAEDISETRNLAGDRADLRRELGAALRDYLVSVDAQMPRDKRTGELVPLPEAVG